MRQKFQLRQIVHEIVGIIELSEKGKFMMGGVIQKWRWQEIEIDSYGVMVGILDEYNGGNVGSIVVDQFDNELPYRLPCKYCGRGNGSSGKKGITGIVVAVTAV